jgi:hypothetical protein
LRTRYQPDPYYESERQIRILCILLRRKARNATFGEISTFGTNCVLILLGAIAASIYGCQLQQMTFATRAATSSANTARDSLNLANRPWIKVVSITPRVTPPGTHPFPALSFQHYGLNNTWVQFDFSVTIENLGPSVASRTNISVMPMTPDLAKHGDDVLALETLFCANERKAEKEKTGRDVGGITIFPKDPFERPSAGFWFGINPKVIQHPPNFSDQTGYFPLSVIGCVTYQSPVSQDIYQTGFVYDVGAHDRGFRGMIGMIPMGADLPAEDLRFYKREEGYFAQ